MLSPCHVRGELDWLLTGWFSHIWIRDTPWLLCVLSPCKPLLVIRRDDCWGRFFYFIMKDGVIKIYRSWIEVSASWELVCVASSIVGKQPRLEWNKMTARNQKAIGKESIGKIQNEPDNNVQWKQGKQTMYFWDVCWAMCDCTHLALSNRISHETQTSISFEMLSLWWFMLT